MEIQDLSKQPPIGVTVQYYNGKVFAIVLDPAKNEYWIIAKDRQGEPPVKTPLRDFLESKQNVESDDPLLRFLTSEAIFLMKQHKLELPTSNKGAIS